MLDLKNWSPCIAVILLMAAAIVPPTEAAGDMFLNGSFESGTTGWTSTVGRWSLSGTTPAETIITSASSNWSFYSADSAVVTGTALTDPRTGDNLRQVFSGSSAFRVGNSASLNHFARLEQTVTSYSGPDIYFAFAAVLEDPDANHTEPQRPAFRFDVTDLTRNETLYSVAFSSESANSQGITWRQGIRNSLNDGYWYYSDWNLIRIDTASRQGNTLKLSVSTYDCSLGQHGGYAYVDAFQGTLPSANSGVTTAASPLVFAVPEPSSAATAGAGMIALAARVLARRIRSRPRYRAGAD